MKYPAIYESEDGSAYLHASKLLFSHLVNGNSYEWRNIDCADEHEKDKNITTEYLANTYGEVKSKAHAEFIVKLAEVNGIEVVTWPEKITHFNFQDTYGTMKLNLLGSEFCKLKLKKITIPLPPESNANTPEEDFEMQQIEKNNGDNLIFGDADKCKEWPCVGDEVCWSNGCYKGIVKARHWNDLWVMESDGEFSTLYIDDVSKPKTPEEELVDEIESIFRSFSANPDCLIGRHKELAVKFVNDFNITKKPQ